MSFYCEHCHFKNNEVQPAGEMQEQGSRYTFKLENQKDLQRQVLKSDTSTLRIEDLDIEIPPGRGRLTDVEGIVREVIRDLESGQEDRRNADPDIYEKIQAVITALSALIEIPRITLTIDDPAGNSWIEPAPPSDHETKEKFSHKQYPRSQGQNSLLGLSVAQDEREAGKVGLADASGGGGLEDVDILEGHNYELPVDCPGCMKPARIMMQMVNIPHFKQVVISTTDCSLCGYHTNDVKTGGVIPEKGKRIRLDIKTPEDLRRDILKSESCMLSIPECKVEVVPGTMGGRFTTVEGLITQIRDDLRSSIFDTDAEELPDSMPAEKRDVWQDFFDTLGKAIRAEISFTILLEDPLASSYCQSLAGEPGQDPNITEEEYERTAEEEDELGLTDMRTHQNEDGDYVKEPPSFTAAQGEELKGPG